MDDLSKALTNLQLGPTRQDITMLAHTFGGLQIDERVQCPICGKQGIAKEHFWRHRRGKKCLAKRAVLEAQIKAGTDAVRRLVGSEIIARSRK